MLCKNPIFRYKFNFNLQKRHPPCLTDSPPTVLSKTCPGEADTETTCGRGEEVCVPFYIILANNIIRIWCAIICRWYSLSNLLPLFKCPFICILRDSSGRWPLARHSTRDQRRRTRRCLYGWRRLLFIIIIFIKRSISIKSIKTWAFKKSHSAERGRDYEF